ncbi:MAG: hypothetical protein AABZ47_12955 [Planctomycetota bacterium]
MGRDIQFMLLSTDESFGAQLRSLVQKVGGIKIVAEVEEPALLAQAVKQFPVDVVLVNLDPAPDAILPVMGEVASAEPGLVFFAASTSTDGQLILKTMRAGAREFLPKPIEPKSLEEAVEKVALKRGEDRQQGQLIAVVGAAGGVGASTFATNLAVELTQIAKGSVILVDLDYRFGQAATLLDVEPTYTLADLCASPEQLEPSVIAKAVVKHPTGLQVLSRPSSFVQADTMTAASCVGLLTSLLQFNEYVVADGPGRSDPSAKAVLDIADSSFLVLQMLVPHVRNAMRLLEGVRESGGNMGRMHVICNRVCRDDGGLSPDDVSSTLALPVFASIPHDWATVSGAVNLGEPLLTHSPKSKVRLAIQDIAQRLHNGNTKTDDKDVRKKGFLGRMLAGSAS